MYLWLTKHLLLLKICFSSFLNSAMCLNSWCTLEATFRFLIFCAILLCENTNKKDDFASILTAWYYLVFAKKFDVLVR